MQALRGGGQDESELSHTPRCWRGREHSGVGGVPPRAPLLGRLLGAPHQPRPGTVAPIPPLSPPSICPRHQAGPGASWGGVRQERPVPLRSGGQGHPASAERAESSQRRCCWEPGTDCWQSKEQRPLGGTRRTWSGGPRNRTWDCCGGQGKGDGHCLLPLGCRGLCPMPSLPASLSGRGLGSRRHGDRRPEGEARPGRWARASSLPPPPTRMPQSHGDPDVWPESWIPGPPLIREIGLSSSLLTMAEGRTHGRRGAC